MVYVICSNFQNLTDIYHNLSYNWIFQFKVFIKDQGQRTIYHVNQS